MKNNEAEKMIDGMEREDERGEKMMRIRRWDGEGDDGS